MFTDKTHKLKIYANYNCSRYIAIPFVAEQVRYYIYMHYVV